MSIELHCMDAAKFEGTADLVITNPYGPLPKGVIGKPCVISNFTERKALCEEWAQCELHEVSKWGKGLRNTIWVGNAYVHEGIDLTDLVEDEPGWFPVALPALLLPLYFDWERWSDIVIDPFMGRGTVGRVCKMWDLNFIGIDKNPDRVELARHYIGC